MSKRTRGASHMNRSPKRERKREKRINPVINCMPTLMTAIHRRAAQLANVFWWWLGNLAPGANF